MSFSNIFKDLNIERRDYLYLFLLLAYSIVITYVLINFNEAIGIYCSDVYIYLSNSLIFAGYTLNTSYIYLSPLICFLTSLLFRAGLLSEVSIYVITGIMSVIGNIGIYLILKRYFNSLLALCGGILFSSFSLTMLWWANGTLDVPAVGFSIWTVLFLILAVDENPRYYMLAFPLLVISIFTRYTCLFLIPLFVLYYLSAHDFFNGLDLLISSPKDAFSGFKNYLKSDEFKSILKALVLGLIVLGIFIAIINFYGSPLSFLTQGSTFASGSKGEVIDNAYTDDTLFYLHEFPKFLFSQKVVFEDVVPNLVGVSYLSYIILAILFVGIIIFLYKSFNKNRNNEKNSGKDKDNEKTLDSEHTGEAIVYNYQTKHFKTFLKLLFALSLVIAVLGFKINSLITISFLLVDFVILFSLFKNRQIKREAYSIHIFMLAWFLSYFLFFTFLNIKVNRYIITVFPAFIYFVILALNEISDSLDGFKSLKIANFNLSSLIPIVLIVLALISAFTFTANVEHDMDFNDCKIVADYLIQYDGDYVSKEVATNKQRQFSWWLKRYTSAIGDDELDYLNSHNVSYYMGDNNLTFKNYKKIYEYDGINLYERIN